MSGSLFHKDVVYTHVWYLYNDIILTLFLSRCFVNVRLVIAHPGIDDASHKLSIFPNTQWVISDSTSADIDIL